MRRATAMPGAIAALVLALAMLMAMAISTGAAIARADTAKVKSANGAAVTTGAKAAEAAMADTTRKSSATVAAGTQWTLDSYKNCTSLQSAQPSPDGRHVVYTLQRALRTGPLGWLSPRAYVVDANGAHRRALTTGISSSSPSWSPDGRLIAFLSTNANGVANVWVERASGGAPQQVTRATRGVIHFVWSPDSNSIAYVAVDTASVGNGAVVAGTHPTRANLWIVRRGARSWLAPRAVSTRTARQLTNGDYVVASFDWAPSGRTIAYEKNVVGETSYSSDSDILLLDVAARTSTLLAGGVGAQTSPRYSPDGSAVAFLQSDADASDFSSQRVMLASVATGAQTTLADTPNQNPILAGWAHDGRSLYYAELRGTTHAVGVLPVDGSAPRDLVTGTVISPLGVSRNGSCMVLGKQTWSDAPQLYFAKLPADSAAATSTSLSYNKITKIESTLKTLTAPRQELISWKSDSYTIEGLLTYPVGYQAGTRVPLILYVHGGPTGAFVQQYAGTRDIYPVAVFAQRGYAVLRVNPRGSDGYGGAFRRANIQDFGGGDYRDLMTGVDHVIAMGVADPARLGVMGWSYGGFMTAWITTQTNRFVAASDGAGPVDWTSMSGTDDLPDLIPSFFGGLPWQVPNVYTRCSPVTYAANVKTPTLIQHGLCDTRVPYSQGQEWFWTLQKAGVPVTMVSYPRSEHVVAEPALVMDTFQRNLDWFATYLPVN